MSSHDTLRVESQTASAATHAFIIAQTSDLVLQACGLGSTHSSFQPDPARRVDSPQTSKAAAGELDPVVEQLEARVPCRACTPLQTGVACSACSQSAHLPCLAHTQWPGQTAPAIWPGSLARTMGGYQCATGLHR